MKLLEALKEWHERSDFDVISDGCWVAYCGTGLTEKGLKEYEKILLLECKFVKGALPQTHLYVHISKEEDAEQLEGMLMDMAGYCSMDWHEKHFTDEIE